MDVCVTTRSDKPPEFEHEPAWPSGIRTILCKQSSGATPCASCSSASPWPPWFARSTTTSGAREGKKNKFWSTKIKRTNFGKLKLGRGAQNRFAGCPHQQSCQVGCGLRLWYARVLCLSPCVITPRGFTFLPPGGGV